MRFIVSKVFFDTNILVYAFDNRNAKKKRAALDLLASHQRDAFISTQVLQEFYVVTTKKLNIDPSISKAALVSFSENLNLITVSKDMMIRAVDESMVSKLSFWDSLIIVSAKATKCSILYSEDMQSGLKLGELKIINPFVI